MAAVFAAQATQSPKVRIRSLPELTIYLSEWLPQWLWRRLLCRLSRRRLTLLKVLDHLCSPHLGETLGKISWDVQLRQLLHLLCGRRASAQSLSQPPMLRSGLHD